MHSSDITSIFAVALITTIWCSPALSSDVPEICNPDSPSQILACPQTCLAACESSEFATQTADMLDICNNVVRAAASGTVDAAECGTGAVEPELFLPADWHSQSKEACSAQHPPIDTSIKELQDLLQTIPSCVISLSNLACRVEKIGARTSIFDELVKKFQPLQFGSNMCSLKSEEVEDAYSRAQQFGEPLGLLTEALASEQACQEEVLSWINSQTCENDDPTCQIDDTKNFALGQFRTRLDESIKKASAIPTILQRARETQSRIEGGYALFILVCS